MGEHSFLQSCANTTLNTTQSADYWDASHVLHEEFQLLPSRKHFRVPSCQKMLWPPYLGPFGNIQVNVHEMQLNFKFSVKEFIKSKPNPNLKAKPTPTPNLNPNHNAVDHQLNTDGKFVNDLSVGRAPKGTHPNKGFPKSDCCR